MSSNPQPAEGEDRRQELRRTAIDILTGREQVAVRVEQFDHLKRGVAEVLLRKHRSKSGVMTAAGFPELPAEDAEVLREICHELDQEGIIIEGYNEANPDFPFFKVSSRAIEQPQKKTDQRVIPEKEQTPAAIRESILRTILKLQTPSQYVDDTAIAEELGLDVEDVQGHLDILEEEGRVELAKDLQGCGACLSPGQRQEVIELQDTSASEKEVASEMPGARVEGGTPEESDTSADADKTLWDRSWDWTKNHYIGVGVGVLFVVIVGLATFTGAVKHLWEFAAWMWPDTPSITFLEMGEIEVLPQQVNQPEDEMATFRFPLRNTGKKTITVTEGRITLTAVSFRKGRIPYMLHIGLNDHDGHHQVMLRDLVIGESYSIHPDLVIPPDRPKDLYVWLSLPAEDEQEIGFHEVTATLTLHGEDGGSVTSKPFKASIYTHSHDDR